MVHGLVQRTGPGRGHRGHRLRRGLLPRGLPEPPVRLRGHPRPHRPALRRDPAAARPAEHLRGADRRLPEQCERVVARARRAGHRGRAGRRARPPPLGGLRLHPLRQRDRLGQRRLRGPPRPPDGPVHLHRLRRLRPYDRGDARRRHGGPEGHRALHLDVLDRGLPPAAGLHLRHPVVRQGAGVPHGRPAGPDPPGRARRHLRQAAAPGGDRRPALLRDGLRHRQQPDDLRLLPRRRAAVLPRLAHGQSAHPHPRGGGLAGRAGRPGPRPALPDQFDGVRGGDVHRGDRALHRLRRADLPAGPQGRRVRAGAVAPGPLVGTDRSGLGAVGRGDHDPLHAPAGLPRHLEDLQLRPRRRPRRPRLRRHLVARLGPPLVPRHHPHPRARPRRKVAIRRHDAAGSPIPDRRPGPLRLCSDRQHRLGP
ncbi:putative Uncharacterized 50.6 kDa protein in the 5'region of gyrA and gyrB [Streptomyces misionensis JCM 4497]